MRVNQYIAAILSLSTLIVSCENPQSKAEVLRAQLDVSSLSMAIESFVCDYSKFPAIKEATVEEILLVSNKLIGAIDGSDKALNPLEKRYFAENEPNCGRSYLDPWDNEYRVIIDINKDGKVKYNGIDFTTSQLVISYGADGVSSEDDILSKYKK